MVAGQDYTVLVSSGDAHESTLGAQWDNLGASDYSSLYETRYNGGYGDLILLVDKISMRVQFNTSWNITLGIPNEPSCDWKPVHFEVDNFQDRFSTSWKFAVSPTSEVSEPGFWQANERATFNIGDLPDLSTQYRMSINASRPHAGKPDEYVIKIPTLTSSDSTRGSIETITIQLPWSVSMNISSNATLTDAFNICPKTGWQIP